MTGVGNQRILENIAATSLSNPNTIVRVPLIEEVNASRENIRAMCTYLQLHTKVIGVELLPYHDYGAAKYNAVGATGHSFTTPVDAKIEELKSIVSEYGLKVIDFK
jgi:pyruvate formate lyase activating enzyme